MVALLFTRLNNDHFSHNTGASESRCRSLDKHSRINVYSNKFRTPLILGKELTRNAVNLFIAFREGYLIIASSC